MSHTKSTEAERRLASEQALASSRISGHVPTAEYLLDRKAVIAGEMTEEECRARSRARASALELASLKST